MASESQPRIVLFADITQGGGLFSELGDTWAVDVVSSVHANLREITKRHHGTVIKTIGTEIMCTFPSADRAAMASGDMHLRIKKVAEQADPDRRDETGMRDVRLRVGMQLGPLIEEDGDVFGDTVNVAARLMSMAKADQTLCSRQVVEGLPVELRSTTRFLDQVSPRGKTEKIEIYELIWEVEDLTMAAPVLQVAPERKRHVRLTLRCAGLEYVLGDSRPSLSMGRNEDNDLVYPGNFASRKHALVEYTRGRFTITDQSANGTYVVNDTGALIQVRRDAHVLDGIGKIYLGETPDNAPSTSIDYECE